MWISRYLVYFVVFSCMGWIYETIYCTIKERKWANRGFLYGPLCPIYGVGAVAIIFVAGLFAERVVSLRWWQVFLISFFGSIVLEYVTSWGLEKLFHAYWWDYSNVPLNINGRVCFPASCGFGLAGLLIVYVIAPTVCGTVDLLSPVWMEAAALVLTAIISADATLTVSVLTDFDTRVLELDNAINRHMEEFVDTVEERRQLISTRLSEEREYFSRESTERMLQSIGKTHRLALRRVNGFRYPQIKNKKLELAINELRTAVKKRERK